MRTSRLTFALSFLALLLAGCAAGSMSLSVPAFEEAQKHRHQEEREVEKDQEHARYQEVRHERYEEDAQEPPPISTEVTVEAESGEDPELWRWNLEVGESYRLSFESTTDLKISMGGEMGDMMGMMGGMGGMPGMGEMGLETTDRIIMETDLTLHVRERLPDGRYDLEIPVDRMVIEGSGGRITVQDLPDEVRVLRATMTPRGEFFFYERVMVEVKEDGVYGIARFSENPDGTITLGADLGVPGASASSRATINPRTGEVTLTQEVREEQRRTRQVEEEQPVQHIDLLPADVLSMLELPEEPVAAGDRITTSFDAGTINLTAAAPEQCDDSTCGNLRVQMDIDTANFQREAMAQAHAEVPGGVPTMKTNIDAHMLFDVPNGRLFRIAGTANSETDASGMSIEENTTFTLVFFE